MSKISRRWRDILFGIIGIQLGVIIALIIKPLPEKFDLLTFTEVSIGLLVGIVAVIAASLVAFQWSNFEIRLKETKEEAIKMAVEQATQAAVDTVNGNMASINSYTNGLFERIKQAEQKIEELDKRYNYPFKQ